jgi:regulator of PEP synthase PpsR (kinase-PPPase family)
MELIPKEMVEKTWQEVAGFSLVRASKEMVKIGNNQPEFLAFITELTEEMSQEVKELGIYMVFIVYRMFQKTQRKIKRISSEEIIECHEHNESLMERLEGAQKRFLDRAASIQISKQSMS